MDYHELEEKLNERLDVFIRKFVFGSGFLNLKTEKIKHDVLQSIFLQKKLHTEAFGSHVYLDAMESQPDLLGKFLKENRENIDRMIDYYFHFERD